MRYDAVVAGAGPAGAATAAHLARSGARVLLCDRAPHYPWRDKACGGGLTPRGVAALDRLRVELPAAEAMRVGGLEMVGHGHSLAVAFPETKPWPSFGLVGRRSDIDARILDAAIAAGAEFRAQTRVVGPLFSDGVCTGVRVASNGSTEDILSDWSIAADGAQSGLARAAGLSPSSTRAAGSFWYTALRGYFAPVAPHSSDGEPVLEFYPLRSGGRWLPAYGWVFPLPDGSANVGVDIPHSPSLARCPTLHTAYDDFVARLRRDRPGFEGAEAQGPPRGALLPEGMRGFRPGAPGLLAVGDAAGLITAFSGEGIAYALEAAELAADAIRHSTGRTETVRRYGTALRDEFGFQFSAAITFMKAMRRPGLATVAATAGLRSPRLLRAAVRIMAYLVERPPTESTVSNIYRRIERIWPSRARA